MTIFKYNTSFQRAIFAIMMLCPTVVLSGCGDSSEAPPTKLEVALQYEKVAATSTDQFLNIKADGAWSISFEYEGEDTNWCTAVPPNGVGSTDIARISYTKNRFEEPRNAIVKVTSGNETVSATMTQVGINDSSDDDTGGVDPGDPDPDPDLKPSTKTLWLELPKIDNIAPSEKVITHSTTLKGKSVRSFSMLFSTTERIAFWVAYPHYSAFIGSSGRAGSFSADPKIGPADQMSSTISGYDRGHQIPSGDRTVDKPTNGQTFYYSNMTPQLGALNQQMWANLENKVRGYLSGCDTLYVVTGAILKTVNGNETVKYVNDKSNRKIAVPNYYFKVLLRLKSGNYDAIGFWFNHKGYGNGDPGAAQSKSIDEIEKLTGFDFFYNLPEATQKSVEAAWKPADWGLR